MKRLVLKIKEVHKVSYQYLLHFLLLITLVVEAFDSWDGQIVSINPIDYIRVLGLWGECYEENHENSELFGRQARLGIEPGTSRRGVQQFQLGKTSQPLVRKFYSWVKNSWIKTGIQEVKIQFVEPYNEELLNIGTYSEMVNWQVHLQQLEEKKFSS